MAALLVGVTGVVFIVYSFPPEQYSFYPPCLLYQTTGLHCPGCGGTRCAYALLHGDLAQAAAYNVLVLLFLPYLAFHALNSCWRTMTGHVAFSWRTPTWWPLAVAAVLILFAILRNLPVAPFTMLAPHKI